MICPIMSKQKLMNTNGINFIAPDYTECTMHLCGIWNTAKERCGLIQ